MVNRLASATSPYLLQHADNPVDWYEWGPEAFAAARERDVPVLLSVGYAACHWCHVMAHESFEDPETAALMNELFVNVKVDREERPDVDAIYMDAVQAMTGRGGWPMTVWLTPDGRPIFAGTYFPPTPRGGLPGFRDVCRAVAAAWRDRREELEGQADRLAAVVGRSLPPADDVPPPDVLVAAYEDIRRRFDEEHGGFGGAPKFPQPSTLEFLLRVHAHPWAPDAARMVVRTLEAMAAGGIHDQLEGGFARYSVDRAWLVPHFEKMLYDNAQLARLYLWAGVELDRPELVDVARTTLAYMERRLHLPEGGFASAEDADSEGEEGRFYVWTWEEAVEALRPAVSSGEIADEDVPLGLAAFGVQPEGFFEGRSVLHRPMPLDELASATGRSTADLERLVAAVRRHLLAARERRVRPDLDDKAVAAWNGLAIRAFAEFAAATGDRHALDVARETAGFVLDRLVVDGRLRRSWAKGRPSEVPGFLEDHAAVALGMFALYGASGETRWYEAGRDLVATMVERFRDPDGGAWFATADDAERLIARPRPLYDNPTPSGNALAAEALLFDAGYRGDGRSIERRDEILRGAGRMMETYPSGSGHLLSVLDAVHRGPRELAVVGPDAPSLAQAAWQRFRPHVVVAWSTEPADDPPLLAGRAGTGTLAYVCRSFVCDAPTADPEAVAAALDG